MTLIALTPIASATVAASAVRGRHTRSERLRDAVTRAYAEKYKTKASQKWVSGFAEPQRAIATLELVPL